jgi:cytosine/adenosine deaminase-related metal-dependent hydrolase
LPELLRLSARAARRNRWRLCTHVAESAQEFEMFRHARGEMFAWLKRSTRDMSDCGLGSPVQHLGRCGELSENLLAVHANYLGRGDADLLAKHQVSVAHCPRSHAYFGHGPFRLRRLAGAGVNVCLGTDSLASVVKPLRQTVELNMLEEMRSLSDAKGSPAPQEIVRMATLNGARALGMKGRVGELSKGAFADLIAIPFAGKVADIYDAIVHHPGGVAASMIDGQWAVPPQAT